MKLTFVAKTKIKITHSDIYIDPMFFIKLSGEKWEYKRTV